MLIREVWIDGIEDSTPLDPFPYRKNRSKRREWWAKFTQMDFDAREFNNNQGDIIWQPR